MRVLYVANYQGPEVANDRLFHRNRALGASTKMESFVAAISDLGHETLLASPATPADRTMKLFSGKLVKRFTANGNEYRIRYFPAFDAPVLNRLVSGAALVGHAMLCEKPDVALVYNLNFGALLTAACLRIRGTRIVFEYEDDAAATLSRGRQRSDVGNLFVSVARKLAAGAIVVSPELQAQLGVTNSAVVRGAVRSNLFEIPLRQLGPGEPLRALYCGGLTDAKGVSILLEALDAVSFPLVLTILGEGPLAGLVKARADRDARIRFLGERSREELDAELGKAHVAVNPHRTTCGQAQTLFPFKIAEYLAAGLPVVTSRLLSLEPELSAATCMYHDDDPKSLAQCISAVSASYAEWTSRIGPARGLLYETVSSAAIGRIIDTTLTSAASKSRSLT